MPNLYGGPGDNMVSKGRHETYPHGASSPAEGTEEKPFREHVREDDFVVSACELQRSPGHAGTGLE